MSKPNKANKNNYTQRGRLTPDEMARERTRQDQISGPRSHENATGQVRPKNAEQEPSRSRSGNEESD